MRLAAATFVLLCMSRAAEAGTQLQLGGNYLLDGGPGLFSLTLAADTPLADRLSVGGRFGALVTSAPTTVGAPIDLFLRARIDRAYLEGLIGPWIFFSGDAVRGHAGIGFGLTTRSGVELGAEVGWLSFSRAMIGARLGFRI